MKPSRATGLLNLHCNFLFGASPQHGFADHRPSASLTWSSAPPRADSVCAPALTTTTSSYTSGEPLIPQRTLWLSCKTLTVHFSRPVFPSKQTSCPAAPREYTSPSATVGVARGPEPPCHSEK